MILSFDISTSKIGVCVSDDNKQIVFLDVLKFVPKTTLLRKSQLLFEYCERNLLPLISSDVRVLVEEPLMMVGAGGHAQTTAILQRFNGMATRTLFELFKVEPEMVNVNHARSVLGIKIPRGIDQKQKKQIVIDWVLRNFSHDSLVVEKLSAKTKQNNFQPGVDDMADSVALVAYGVK